MKFLDQINSERERLGMSVRDIADRTGANYQTVHKHLTGQRECGPLELEAYARAVGLDSLDVPKRRSA